MADRRGTARHRPAPGELVRNALIDSGAYQQERHEGEDGGERITQNVITKHDLYNQLLTDDQLRDGQLVSPTQSVSDFQKPKLPQTFLYRSGRPNDIYFGKPDDIMQTLSNQSSTNNSISSSGNNNTIRTTYGGSDSVEWDDSGLTRPDLTDTHNDSAIDSVGGQTEGTSGAGNSPRMRRRGRGGINTVSTEGTGLGLILNSRGRKFYLASKEDTSDPKNASTLTSSSDSEALKTSAGRDYEEGSAKETREETSSTKTVEVRRTVIHAKPSAMQGVGREGENAKERDEGLDNLGTSRYIGVGQLVSRQPTSSNTSSHASTSTSLRTQTARLLTSSMSSRVSLPTGSLESGIVADLVLDNLPGPGSYTPAMGAIGFSSSPGPSIYSSTSNIKSSSVHPLSLQSRLVLRPGVPVDVANVVPRTTQPSSARTSTSSLHAIDAAIRPHAPAYTFGSSASSSSSLSPSTLAESSSSSTTQTKAKVKGANTAAEAEALAAARAELENEDRERKRKEAERRRDLVKPENVKPKAILLANPSLPDLLHGSKKEEGVDGRSRGKRREGRDHAEIRRKGDEGGTWEDGQGDSDEKLMQTATIYHTTGEMIEYIQNAKIQKTSHSKKGKRNKQDVKGKAKEVTEQGNSESDVMMKDTQKVKVGASQEASADTRKKKARKGSNKNSTDQSLDERRASSTGSASTHPVDSIPVPVHTEFIEASMHSAPLFARAPRFPPGYTTSDIGHETKSIGPAAYTVQPVLPHSPAATISNRHRLGTLFILYFFSLFILTALILLWTWCIFYCISSNLHKYE